MRRLLLVCVGLVACSYSAPSPAEPTTEDAPVDTCEGTGTESCNGLDDDCDGTTDEGFDVGLPCDGDDADACATGERQCDGSCSDDPDTVAELCTGANDDDCDGATDCDDTSCQNTPFCCVGEPDGLVHTISNSCVADDFGSSGSSDTLQVFCCGGQARFCLSNESCPWRNGCPAGNTKTCSRGGLAGTMMAIADCQLWKGQTTYGCSLDEQITFP